VQQLQRFFSDFAIPPTAWPEFGLFAFN